MSNQEAVTQGLMKALRDDNQLVRSAAARALGRMKAVEAVPLLMLSLRDKAGLVYDFAVNALSAMPAESVLGPMLELSLIHI